MLYCVACLVELKLAEKPFPETPAREAVAMLNGQTTCFEHIVVQQPSPLSAPNGSPILRQR